MGLLAWLVAGLIAGWLASRVMKGRGSGLSGNLVLGVLGALLRGLLAATLPKMSDAANGINVTSILVAFVGVVPDRTSASGFRSPQAGQGVTLGRGGEAETKRSPKTGGTRGRGA